jgi:rod shape-determining protein MreB
LILGIDIGTSWSRLVKKNQGVVLEEPSVVALDRNSQRILAVGTQAHQVFGKTPGSVVALPAFRGGVISDVRATQELLRKLIRSVGGRIPVKPTVYLSVATPATVIERRALIETAVQAGAREVKLVLAPLAAARGAGLDTRIPRARLVANLGGGAMEVALVSMDEVLFSASERSGGEATDERIQRHIRQAYGLMIGLADSEDLKRLWGPATGGELEVSGLGVIDGLPRILKLTHDELESAVRPQLHKLLGLLREVLERCPPELAADIFEDGLYLVGGGAATRGLPELLSSVLGLKARCVARPEHCVGLGLLA